MIFLGMTQMRGAMAPASSAQISPAIRSVTNARIPWPRTKGRFCSSGAILMPQTWYLAFEFSSNEYRISGLLNTPLPLVRRFWRFDLKPGQPAAE
jgi:hypothetical protein